ncbi:putative uncharacterized protein DDB_G0282133 isoform X2 [Galleria mellonella]|uniref:Chitin-binding type-2 domain-containing protein n=1 Tax=Galleria mellonella TaxID=7137 RepID=A0A6J3C4K2_GALME|nr:putative uncharacterized protein DDB_G0282133 isoform X2 [Galleria mellonella]
MWSFFVILVFGCSWVEGQNGREEHNHEHHGNGWDIRLAVPGEPGSDYPILGTIPKTSFSCAGREPGYYADLETNCQVFRICTVGSTYGFQSFLCPNGTLFNQAVFVCDWWMNVNCEKSEELFNNNNERFGNLRLGPQLMKDVKKMLMHPMRNPYDKTTMKSNLVVMQTYKPPFGQMYPNAALLAYTDRTPKNVYLPPQQLQSPIQNGDNNDISFSASTPQPLYLPASFNAAQNTPQGEAEVFQRQKEQRTHHNQFKNIITSSQSDRFAQNSNALNSNNNNYSQITRPIQRNNVLVNAQYGQKQEINTNPTFVIPNQTNNPKGQVSLQNSQYDNNFKFTQFNTGKQQQYSSNQDNEAYIYNTPTPRFNEITKHEEAKQNLALVFSLLADSINIAKEYNNVIHENMLPTPKIAQFQNVNSEQLAQITNTISQLTSSQYSGNNYNNINKAKIISTPLTPPNTGYQYRELAEQVTKNQQQIQSNDFLPSTIPTPQQTNQNIFMTQFQNGKSNLNSNYQTHMSDQNQIYSGQLYQLPVPDVIDQIYNRQSFSQSSANNAQSQVSSNLNNINNVRSSSTEIETVKSKTMPARLQLPPSDESNNIHENINKYLSPDNTISAQIRDKIVGTIVHPLEDNKLVNYEKDQTYIVYSKANNVNGQTNSFSLQTSPVQNQQRARLIQGTSMPNQISFQLIPSIGYQLEDEKEQQKILNAFQINEFGSPKTKTGQIVKSNTRQDIIASDINYTVDHTSSTNNQINSQYNNINSLYAGPSSYSAPQSSIGNLIQRQDINSRSELNENNGYSRIIPERPYLV